MIIIKFLSLIYLGIASINNFIETYKEYQLKTDILVVIIMAILTILSTISFIYVAII